MLKMHENPMLEAKTGVEKSKFCLSLNRKNALNSNGENKTLSEKANSEPNNNKENKPLKRSFNRTYNNTLNAAKKLKPLTEITKPTDPVKTKLIVLNEPHNTAMLNGHHPPDSQYGGSIAKKPPIATLSNLGNTCFLNSVLYTLRYAPRFLHNLHHLVTDLANVEQKLGSIRQKSSSLGRSASGLVSSGTRSWSSKDLLSLGQSDNCVGKTKIQIATEKLHETYFNLRAAESKCMNSNATDTTPEPYAADAFLAALRDVNSTFEGNRQQDAHELLVCILDNIRETCQALSIRASRLLINENGDSNGIARQPSIDNDSGKTLGGIRKSWKRRKEGKEKERNGKRNSPIDERAPSPADNEREERNKPGWDFVAEDFEGTMVVRTKCLECETVTEKSQVVCELCVPVGDDDISEEEPFKAACLTTEYLRDQNKYWCECCLRYNEARRTVSYSRLPHLLVLQLKRFSGGMEKITRHAPTPLRMPCFCESCVFNEPQHTYALWAVIMHLGQTLTVGHYVAYARDANNDMYKCEREGAGDSSATNNSGASFMRTLFNRPRPQSAGCTAKECCIPRYRPESSWLACDDDLVKPMSNEEFEELLSTEPKSSAATPYLLFYVKSEVG